MKKLAHPSQARQTALKAAASALLVTLLLQGCGGGGGSVANNSTGSQLASGVVTGFGSVFVDGVEIEDAKASVITENANGSTSNSVLQMGQSVRVDHDGKGTASKVTVDAAVIGAVSSIDTTAQTLTVAAQKVRINNDVSTGPITVWAGGYTSLSDVLTTDLVEVHGSPVFDSATSSYQLVATRIQKMSAISSLKVNGKITNIDTTAKTFSLNGLTVSYAAATQRPSGATLANDLLVTAFGPTSALSGTTLTANNLKVNRLQNSTATDTTAQIGGQVSRYDSTNNTFEVQGVKVAVGSATITPAGARVSNSAYVKVSGTVGSDGSLTATAIQVREQSTNNDLAKVKLMGVISDFVDNASFVVRGVPVDASGINASTACPGVTLANDVPVQITATQQSNTPVVLATNMNCQTPPNLVIRPADGVVSSVNTTTKTFTLTAPGNAVVNTVLWSDTTTFVGLTSASLSTLLSTQSVRVEGYVSNGNLVARVVSLNGGNDGLDDDRFQHKAPGDSASGEWTRYRSNHGHH